jgi:hypothetical protein
MAAFVTLCIEFIGIDPDFNLWCYFFRPGCGKAWVQVRRP